MLWHVEIYFIISATKIPYCKTTKKWGGKTFAYERTDLAGELRVAKHVIYILEWPHSWPLANSLQFAGFSWIFGIIYAVIADAQGRGWGN